MQSLFNTILKMSVSAIPVVVLVLCLRWIFKKYPKSYSFALWLVVFASLAVPFKVPVSFVPQLDTAAEEVTQAIVQEFETDVQQNDIIVHNTAPVADGKQHNAAVTVPKDNTQHNVAVQTQPQSSVVQNVFTLRLWHIWLCGILVLLAFEIVNLKGIYDKTRFAFRKQGNIYLCDEISRPFVFGIVKPKIFLPSDISPQDERYVTQHEQTHIDRMDYVLKPLCFAIAAVHWFNPFAWLSFYLMEKDMELSCDEKVVKTLDTAGVQNYCTSLLAFAVKDKPYKINAVLFGEGNCSMRIKNILSFKQPKRGTAILLSFCVLLAGCTAFATGESQPAQNGGSGDMLSTDSYNETYADKEQENNQEVFNYQDLWVKENDAVDIMWFSDATFVGDSVTEGLRIYTTIANSVGDVASFVSAKNLSPSDIVSGTIDSFEHLTAQNGIDAIAAAKPEKIYITLGTNALVEMSEKDFLKDYGELLKTLKEKFSSAQIYVTSVPPVTKEFTESRNLPIFKPENLEYVNGQLAQMARDNNAYYLNLHEVLADGDGYLKKEYAYTDGMHINPEAYTEWIEYLMTHTADEGVEVCSYPKQEYFEDETELKDLIIKEFEGQHPQHSGITLKLSQGAPVFAIDDGVVTTVKYTDDGYGNYIKINHGDYYTLYAHCDTLNVGLGQEVAKDEIIATAGKSGEVGESCLRFEVIPVESDGKADLRVDPLEFFSEDEVTGLYHNKKYQQFLEDIDSSQKYHSEATEIITETETEVAVYYDSQPISLPMLEAGKYVFPVDMANKNIRISRGYTGQYPSHDGIDIAGPYGTEIFASADGKVIKAEESTVGDGNHVVIEHANGYYTLYGHCSELLVKAGDEVKQGDLIAKMGSTGNSTGNHVHFEFGIGYESEANEGLTLDPYNAVPTRCGEDLNGVSIGKEYQQSSDNNSTTQTNVENEQYYTAQSGDSPISIAKAYKLNVEELYAMNPGIEKYGVFVGDKVRVTQPLFGWPTGGGVRISRGYVGQYPDHNGVDIAGAKGTDIVASAYGKVIEAAEDAENYGKYIVLEHTGGYRTLYAHCSELLVEVGDEVNKGDVIAKMGSTGNATGNQLHFEIILENDTRIDPYTKW